MANLYATLTQFNAYYDQRTLAELSNDEDGETIDSAKVDLILDDAADELDALLAGRWPTQAEASAATWVRPGFLRRWVIVKAAQRMFGRRFDLPASLEADIAWADGIETKLIEGTISMPNMGRSNGIALLASNGRGQGEDRVTDNMLDLGFPPRSIREGEPSE